MSSTPSPNGSLRVSFERLAAAQRDALAIRAASSHTRSVWRQWWRTWEAMRLRPRSERFLAVCSSCRWYRDHQGQWQELPPTISRHLRLDSPLQITHGLCPECLPKIRVG